MNRIKILFSGFALLALAATAAGAANRGGNVHNQRGLQHRPVQEVKRLNALQQGDSLLLRWQPVPGCDGYRVYHEQGARLQDDSTWVDVDATRTEYLYNDVMAGNEYTFVVSAFYGKKEGPLSTPVTVRIPDKNKGSGPSDTAR